MSDTADQVRKLCAEIEALQEESSTKEKAVLELLRGVIATDRRGKRYKIDRVRVPAGSVRPFIEGPLLKRDGTPHATTRLSVPLGLLVKLERDKS